jgi:outer membrane lipopolysaccharide assembly protein LptE/RlpB
VQRYSSPLAAFVLALLVGCGFQLRGSYSLPFDSLYLAVPDHSVLGAQLRRTIRAAGTTRLGRRLQTTRKPLFCPPPSIVTG